MAGSFLGRLAFMGKLVLGRFSVVFRSSGNTRLSGRQNCEIAGKILCAFLHYREPENARLCASYAVEGAEKAARPRVPDLNRECKALRLRPQGQLYRTARLCRSAASHLLSYFSAQRC